MYIMHEANDHFDGVFLRPFVSCPFPVRPADGAADLILIFSRELTFITHIMFALE